MAASLLRTSVLLGVFGAILGAEVALAQETRYVSDKLFVPIRSGAGGDYRIVNKGIPSGTAITWFADSEDGAWAEIETRGGTRGWMRNQFIQSDPPAALMVQELQAQLDEAQSQRDRLRSSLSASASEASEAGGENSVLRLELEETKSELAEVRRVSGAALELDAQNRQLVAELESERAEAELLRLENVRLTERISNAQLIDGAIAVLLGVVIAVLLPRLLPRKRRNDGWA